MCEYVQAADQRLVGNFMVQRTWSNGSAAAGHDPCVPALTTQPYVGAAPELQDVAVMQRGQTIMTKAIPIALGTSQTIELDLFSDGPGQDFTVKVEDVKVLLGEGTPDLTFSFDKTIGHNGDKLKLTITRGMTATSSRGSEFVVIEARYDDIVTGLWWGYSTVAM